MHFRRRQSSQSFNHMSALNNELFSSLTFFTFKQLNIKKIMKKRVNYALKLIISRATTNIAIIFTIIIFWRQNQTGNLHSKRKLEKFPVKSRNQLRLIPLDSSILCCF